MINAHNLTKVYRIARPKEGRFAAVDGVDFTIEDGEVVGYIGPNGAGKSTTIKMLSGILTPTSGEVRVNGRVPYQERRAHARGIGVVFGQKTSLWWDVPVIDSFRLLKEMYRIPDERFRRNLDAYVGMLEMESFLHQPVRQLSLGQRMRADLAAAPVYPGCEQGARRDGALDYARHGGHGKAGQSRDRHRKRENHVRRHDSRPAGDIRPEPPN